MEQDRLGPWGALITNAPWYWGRWDVLQEASPPCLMGGVTDRKSDPQGMACHAFWEWRDPLPCPFLALALSHPVLDGFLSTPTARKL